MMYDVSELDLSSLFSDMVASLDRLVHRVFAAEVTRELSDTALALKRHHLRHGRYPRELSALVPEFLPSPPRDPADGQLLRYRLNADGSFLLYSVGEDGTDHGGDASPASGKDLPGWTGGRDLVWPGRATPQEADAWQAKQGGKRGS
jgi:hypothetical protein